MADPGSEGLLILGAAGDPGGSKALLPVFAFLDQLGIPFRIFDHGFMGKEAPSHWEKLFVPPSRSFESLNRTFRKDKIRAYVFASSVKDPFALQRAYFAREKEIPVVHVLDHWTNYLKRIRLDSRSPLFPDVYTVMDQSAYEGAMAAGIPPSILHIAGQPALSSLLHEYPRLREDFVRLRGELVGSAASKKQIIFVSEPVASDQGTSPAFPNYRGYTEKTVLSALLDSLQPFHSLIKLLILPHPRENPDSLTDILLKKGGGLEWQILDNTIRGREAVNIADGVIGMASILLYEAWLIGKPVISLQPDLRVKDLAFMENKEGYHLICDRRDLDPTLSEWLTEIGNNDETGGLREEIQIHADAPKTITQLIMDL